MGTFISDQSNTFEPWRAGFARAIDALETRLDRETWLAGKERARTWTPAFPSATKALNLPDKADMKTNRKTNLRALPFWALFPSPL